MATGAGAPRTDRRRYGRLGLQLALLLIFVAVGAVAVANVVAATTVFNDAQRLLHQQEADQASAAALGAAVTYTPSNTPSSWGHALIPVVAVASRSGSAIRVTDSAGRPVRSSPGFAAFPPGPVVTKPVKVGGRSVGEVTVKFDNHGIGGLVRKFEARRWRARLIAAGFGALFALVVALLVAPLVTRPVDRLLMTARARGAGQTQSRVGRVRGVRDLRELAATFDEMADTLGQEDRLRRNLVANVAHELRTPIAVLQATTEAMFDGLTPLTPDTVRSLHDEAVRLGQMTGDLQRLAAAEAAALELSVIPCDLAGLADEAASSLAGIFDVSGVRLSKRLEHVWTRCDPARMREVITNLLTNAAKFTPDGGAALVSTRRGQDAAILEVIDTGIGIAAEDLPRLAERFYRGRDSSQTSGSGIGLAIVDELVSAHHGTWEIASVLHEGTRVTIRMPLLASPAR